MCYFLFTANRRFRGGRIIFRTRFGMLFYTSKLTAPLAVLLVGQIASFAMIKSPLFLFIVQVRASSPTALLSRYLNILTIGYIICPRVRDVCVGFVYDFLYGLRELIKTKVYSRFHDPQFSGVLVVM